MLFKNLVAQLAAQLTTDEDDFRQVMDEIAADAFNGKFTGSVPVESIVVNKVKDDESGSYYRLRSGEQVDFMHIGAEDDDEDGLVLYPLLVGHVY